MGTNVSSLVQCYFLFFSLLRCGWLDAQPSLTAKIYSHLDREQQLDKGCMWLLTLLGAN